MRFPQLLRAVQAIRASSLLFVTLSALAGCATREARSEDDADRGIEKSSTAPTIDKHRVALTSLDQSGGASDEAGLCSMYDFTAEEEAGTTGRTREDAYEFAFADAESLAQSECRSQKPRLCTSLFGEAKEVSSSCSQHKSGWWGCSVTVSVDCQYRLFGGEE